MTNNFQSSLENLLVGEITEERIKANAKVYSRSEDKTSPIDWVRLDMRDGNTFVGEFLRTDPAYSPEQPFNMAMRKAMAFYKRVQMVYNYFNEKQKAENSRSATQERIESIIQNYVLVVDPIMNDRCTVVVNFIDGSQKSFFHCDEYDGIDTYFVTVRRELSKIYTLDDIKRIRRNAKNRNGV